MHRLNCDDTSFVPAVSTIPTDISSIVEVCVTSRADVLNENCPTPSAATRGREKRLGSARYNKLQEELEEMRRLENKMRGAMNRLHNGVVYERSRGTKGSSSSGASTMCEVVQEYEKYLEMYPFKEHELAGSEVLEEHIRTHLMKIKHQIGLVEKYNRALLEKESKRSRSGGRRKPSKTNEIRNPRARGYDKNESTEEKQSMPVFKTRIPIPSSRSRGTSYDQFPTTTSSNNFTKYSSDAKAKHIKLGTRIRDPPPPAAKLGGSGLRNPVVDNRLPATVEYERWTWPNERQVTTKRSHEAPIGKVKSVHEKVADKSRGKPYIDKDKRHSSGDQDHNGGLTDDEGSQTSYGVTENDCDEMNRTFTKQKLSATDHKLHEEERGRKLNRGTHTDEPEEQSRDKSSGRKTRNPWTLTDNNSKTREQEFPTAEYSKPEAMHGDAQIPVPSVKIKKSVAFYVPLFCDNCNEPVEPDNNSKGNCYNCQNKFKWFCETKGEDGLYDAKGPLGIQECFKDAWCSEKLQKRSEDLLSSRFERLSDDDKLYLGMLAKQFSGQEATAFLRNKCHFEGDELLERVCKYLEICRNHKEQDFGAMKEPEKRQNLVVTEQEMRERTARLRGESAILMEKRRREEEQCRRAANRLLKNTYDLKVRKCLKVGGRRNIGIFSEVNVFKYRYNRDNYCY
ncbi:hypothetical protein Ocin01_14100 [Orchesella cincta]|uniref:Uncharacterized protein n=1 Tax=Orchesella cincta TaxID=48709 RepID=A0A1D2MI43_ORCCI|nr:hypothetical protein Ocin01_14100 [Orchesella cincta]